MKLLLSRENPGNVRPRWGKAPQVVDQLFGRGYVSPDSSCKYGRTPLSWAAGNRYDRVVEPPEARNSHHPR